MIELKEKITVNADMQMVWAFLTDIEKSLSYNRFHVKIDLPNRFSINSFSEFKIVHNFGFGNIDMTAKIIECIPLKHIIIMENTIGESSKGFAHKIKFDIIKRGKFTSLTYFVSGTYGGRVQDLSFAPILKGVLKEEIIKIKNAIESSDIVPQDITVGHISP